MVGLDVLKESIWQTYLSNMCETGLNWPWNCEIVHGH